MAKQRRISDHRVARVLRAYGARRELWPADVRQDAEESVQENAELAALEMEEAELDALLSRAAAPSPDRSLHARIRMAARTLPPESRVMAVFRNLTWPLIEQRSRIGRPNWSTAIALALALFTGMAAGAVPAAAELEPDELLKLAFGPVRNALPGLTAWTDGAN